MRKFLLSCFLLPFSCTAQQLPFVHYTPRDGLINGRVRSIQQDSRVRMFFLTYGGLSIYDGTRFLNYNTKNGLAHDLVNDVIEVGSQIKKGAVSSPCIKTIEHKYYKSTD